jgi:hypothetical protein
VFKYLESIVQFKNISHVFVTWKEREEVMRIAILLKKHHPNIKLFIRVFDEVIGDVVHGLGAHAFSTSQFAFSMLQQYVSKDSLIYVAPKEAEIAEEQTVPSLESPMQVRSIARRKQTISFTNPSTPTTPTLARSKSDFKGSVSPKSFNFISPNISPTQEEGNTKKDN